MEMKKGFFETLLNTASEGVVVQDRHGRITWCNPAAETILGLGQVDVRGRTSEDPEWAAIHEDGTEFPGDRHPAMVTLKTGQALRGIVMGIRHPSRGRVWISVNSSVVEWEDGVPSLVMSTFTDITERQAAQWKAMLAETVVEKVADAVSWLDPNGRFIYANGAWVDLLGYSPAEMATMTASDINPGHPRESWPEHWSALIKAGSMRFEAELRAKDGSLVAVEISANHIRHHGKDYNVAIVRDMRQRNRAKAEILEGEARLVATLQHTPNVAVQWYGDDGRVLYWNPASESVFGWKAEEAVGKRLEEFFCTADESAQFDALFQRLRIEGSPIGPSEYTVRRKDGAECVVLATTFPIPGRDGTTWFVFMDVDITERKQAEEAMRRTIDALAAANTELERFAYAASHDLREPLRTIAAFTELLERRHFGESDAEAREFAGLVVNAAQRMHELIGGLAQHAAAHGKPAAFEPVSLAEASRIASANLRQAIEESGAVVELSGLPTINGDLLQMGQVFQNLIGNAIKFSKPGIPPHIVVAAVLVENKWRVTVSDNGIGIEETGQDIFEIFRRLHGPASYPGSGVGLSITKAIIHRHGGRIWHEPSTDGARLVFELPAIN